MIAEIFEDKNGCFLWSFGEVIDSFCSLLNLFILKTNYHKIDLTKSTFTLWQSKNFKYGYTKTSQT